MSVEEIESAFPNLAGSGYEITDEASGCYNCIAWTLGITSKPWDALDPDAYWPPSLARNYLVFTVMQLFADEGYSRCDDDAVELGYEKIAIYAFIGQFTHVAKQLTDGRWASKMGKGELITHPSLASLARGIYGNIHCIMRLRRNSPGGCAIAPRVPLSAAGSEPEKPARQESL